MPTVESSRMFARRIEAAELRAIWGEIRAHLDRERVRLHEEMRDYPTPIPNCDQDFNHMVQLQAKISQELARVDALAKESIARGSCELLDEYLRSSNSLGDAAKHSVGSRLK